MVFLETLENYSVSSGLTHRSQVTTLTNRLGFTDEYKSLTATVNNQIGADSAAIKVLAGLTPSRDDNIHH